MSAIDHDAFREASLEAIWPAGVPEHFSVWTEAGDVIIIGHIGSEKPKSFFEQRNRTESASKA